MIEHLLRDWSEFAVLVGEQFKKGWIYRGVRKSSYPLRPNIGRGRSRVDAKGIVLPYDLGEEKRLLRQFKREGRVKFSWEPQFDLEWMILGQHHRLPTRLLDWTESLLVAAYFAVEDPREDAAIYGVELLDEIVKLNTNPFSSKLDKRPKLIRPPHITPRITAQKSVLTLHSKPDQDWEEDDIHKWTIPKAFTLTLKGILDFCGLHAASLFPDSMDRHTEHLAWLYKRGRLS